jgi:hypothetical protein
MISAVHPAAPQSEGAPLRVGDTAAESTERLGLRLYVSGFVSGSVRLHIFARLTIYVYLLNPSM